MMQPWPTVNQAFMLIKQEEKQRQIHNVLSQPIAMMASVPRSNFKAADKIPSLPSHECSHCHLKGHTREKCYKLVVYPIDHPYHPNNRGKRRPNARFGPSAYKSGTNGHAAMQVTNTESNNSSKTQFGSNSALTTQMEVLQNQMNTLTQCFTNKPQSPFVQNQSTPPGAYSFSGNIAGTAYSLSSSLCITDNVWILDTGATNHMCCNLTHMHDVQTIVNPYSVTFPNGEQAFVPHLGSVMLHSISLVLHDGLYIPSFTFNLLSISKLSSQLYSKVWFESNSCYLQDQSQNKALVLGNMVGGLYQLINIPPSSFPSFPSSAVASSFS